MVEPAWSIPKSLDGSMESPTSAFVAYRLRFTKALAPDLSSTIHAGMYDGMKL
jgi:hypothetical protein